MAAWGKVQIEGALGAAGANAAAVVTDKLGQVGVLYKGLETLGGGAPLAGIILGSVTVSMIDRECVKASAVALTGAVLTFFGSMHGEEIGFAGSPAVAFSCLAVAGMLFACAKYAESTPAEAAHNEPVAAE